jgi:UDP-2,4-diacetamido-2,4,6-trideoxy-beta-L-altropyranose hydrolase
MKIVFRTDASLDIGTGHVMRCLTLAISLRENGAECLFLCRQHEGSLISLILKNGFKVIKLPVLYEKDNHLKLDSTPHAHWLGCHWLKDASDCQRVIDNKMDWLIVDHYALERKWETAMRNKFHKIMCIDDLADRHHDCDLLLDQSYGRISKDYYNLVPSHAKQLLGPAYALLRPEFSKWKFVSLLRRKVPELCHILISMGGVDKDNISCDILDILKNCNLPNLNQITVILGINSIWINEVNMAALGMPITTKVLLGANNMAELMASCDLAIGAGGATTWERCSLGVPSILINTAQNQNNIAKQMQSSSATFVINSINEINYSLPKLLSRCSKLDTLLQLSTAASKITDALGTDRVTSELINDGI